MTGKADFTEQEWDLVRTAPVDAGMIVMTADHGGMMRETMAMAKAYAETRGEHGNSPLLDELVSSRPERDHTKFASYADLRDHGLKVIRDAVALLESKATPEEVDDFRGFVRRLAERVASRHEENGQQISPAEQTALDEISAALGG